MNNYSNFIIRVYLARFKAFLVAWLRSNSPICKNFLKHSVAMSFFFYIKLLLLPVQLSFDFFSKIWFSFCYLVGFFTLIAQIQHYLDLTETQTTFLIFFILILFVVRGSNFLIRFISWILYWFFLLIVFAYVFFTGDLLHYYSYLLVVIAVVRPLWHFLIELLFFLLIKQIYPYSWFQKLLPYLSPNFDPLEIKSPNENSDSKTHT